MQSAVEEHIARQPVPVPLQMYGEQGELPASTQLPLASHESCGEYVEPVQDAVGPHAVPLVTSGYVHSPVPESHVAPTAVWHTGGVSQVVVVPPPHTPPLQVVPLVQRLLSSHTPPALVGVWEHTFAVPKSTRPVVTQVAPATAPL